MHSYSVSGWLTDFKFEGSCRDSSVELFSSSRPAGFCHHGQEDASLLTARRTCVPRLCPSHASRLPRFLASQTLFPPIPRIKDKWTDGHRPDQQVGEAGTEQRTRTGRTPQRRAPQCPRGVWLASRSCSPADLTPQQPHAPFPPQVIWENFTLDTEKGDNEEILTVQEVPVAPARVGTA